MIKSKQINESIDGEEKLGRIFASGAQHAVLWGLFNKLLNQFFGKNVNVAKPGKLFNQDSLCPSNGFF